MRLAPTMVVFGFLVLGHVGFSKILNQLNCSTISLDTSNTALEIGKQLFKNYPVVGRCIKEPVFFEI